MRLQKISKLNSRGFGHVELLLVVVLVVAVALTGFFVYKHDKKTVTAHAGSYSYGTTIGSANFRTVAGKAYPDVTASVSVCKIIEPNTPYGELFHIEMLATLSPAPSNSSEYAVSVTEAPSPNPNQIWRIVSHNNLWWDNEVAAPAFYVSELKVNYLGFSVQYNGTPGVGIGIDKSNIPIRADSIANC